MRRCGHAAVQAFRGPQHLQAFLQEAQGTVDAAIEPG